MFAYKGLGGRFWSISPSTFTNLGSFSRRIMSLPATDSYATSSQRRVIERMGIIGGCHTCGSRQFYRFLSKVKFHADHMPPRSVARQMNESWFRKLLFRSEVKQRFYPQCSSCSNIQGSLLGTASGQIRQGIIKNLSRVGGGKEAYYHGMRLRMEHFAGFLVSAVTVWDSRDLEVIKGNKKRFEMLQKKLSG